MNWRRSLTFGLSGCLALGLSLCGSGCSSGSGVSPAAPAAAGDVVDFVFPVPGGELVSSRNSRGRATAVLFITTYDLSSQEMATRLDRVLRRHRPRANGLAVVLEPPKNAPFAQEFAAGLGLSYPVAMADPATLRGDGPFGKLEGIPTVVVLDHRGRTNWRAQGLVSVEALREALSEGSAKGFAPGGD